MATEQATLDEVAFVVGECDVVFGTWVRVATALLGPPGGTSGDGHLVWHIEPGAVADDTGDVLNVTTTVLAADEVHVATLTVDESGFYSYEIDTRNTAATISVDIERKTKLDMIFLPLGVLILAMGVYQRLATKDDDVLDAELDA